MTTQPLQPILPVQPLYAEGRILAGFLTEETARSLPEFLRAPEADQNGVRKKFGFAETRPAIDFPTPAFRHIDEPEAIAVIASGALQCGGPADLGNLVGFEWVEIAPIIAGSYVAAPMPAAGRTPNDKASLREIAGFCIFGTAVGFQDVTLMLSDDLTVASAGNLRIRPNRIVNFNAQGFVIEYAFYRDPSPIALLFMDDRLIAMKHQERLVALVEAGIKEALCLVYYGFGMEVLRLLPTLNSTLLTSERPPRVVDFTDEQVMVKIPVQAPSTLVTFSRRTTDFPLTV